MDLGGCKLALIDFKPYLEHERSVIGRAYTVKLYPVKTSGISTKLPGKQVPQTVANFCFVGTAIRDYVRVRIRRVGKVSFLNNFAYVLNG